MSKNVLIGCEDNPSIKTYNDAQKACPLSMVGMTLEQAKSWCHNNNMSLRVVKVDGSSLVRTADYTKTRINVDIENNVVVKYYVG